MLPTCRPCAFILGVHAALNSCGPDFLFTDLGQLVWSQLVAKMHKLPTSTLESLRGLADRSKTCFVELTQAWIEACEKFWFSQEVSSSKSISLPTIHCMARYALYLCSASPAYEKPTGDLVIASKICQVFKNHAPLSLEGFLTFSVVNRLNMYRFNYDDT